MMCPTCKANLVHINAAGEPMLRNHGLVLKAEGVALVCPECKGDVAMGQDVAKAFQSRLMLIFTTPRKS